MKQQSGFNLNIICLQITEVVHPAVELSCFPPGLADLHWFRHDHWHCRGVHGDWYVWNKMFLILLLIIITSEIRYIKGINRNREEEKENVFYC